MSLVSFIIIADDKTNKQQQQVFSKCGSNKERLARSGFAKESENSI